MNRFNLGAGFCSAVLVLSGCVKQSTFDASQAQLADAQKQLAVANDKVSELQKQLAVASDKVSELQKQLDAENAQLSETQGQLSMAKAIPVRVGFHKAFPGPGFVAVLVTTLKRELPVTVEVKSHGFGTTKTFQVILPPLGRKELSYVQGAAFEDGDEIRISNPDFEPLFITFHPKS
jgi:hypothetical protein